MAREAARGNNMLKQDAVMPLYEQLMNAVEKKIRDGFYKPGDKIAT